MPRLLIVAATVAEISLLQEHFRVSFHGKGLWQASSKTDVLITGVGMVNTAYMMGRHVSEPYDIIINAGICGAFNRNLSIGQVVNITNDTLAEMGAEDGTRFIPYEELGLGGGVRFSNRLIHLQKIASDFQTVTGITVNTVHGQENSINSILSRMPADVESMEGAAFFRACDSLPIDYLQIRAVSNYVEKRDKSKWNIPLAVSNLHAALVQIIDTLNRTS